MMEPPVQAGRPMLERQKKQAGRPTMERQQMQELTVQAVHPTRRMAVHH